MPRRSALLTPSASGEITGKDNPASPADQSFKLPPPAVQINRTASVGGSNHRPIRPAKVSDQLPPPPPPTRSRTLSQATPNSRSQSITKRPPCSPTDGAFIRKQSAPNAVVSVKKQPTTTSAAGKKIARKTAHSVIERRRRSKMNEEFATLQDLIPACSGQDMHKLAILQVISFSKVLNEDSNYAIRQA